MSELHEALDHIEEIGSAIAVLTAKAKVCRRVAGRHYEALPKMPDGITGCCHLTGPQRLVMIRPVRKDDADQDGEILDFTITFADCPSVRSSE